MEYQWQELMKTLYRAWHLENGYNFATDPAHKDWVVIKSTGKHGPIVIFAGEFLKQEWNIEGIPVKWLLSEVESKVYIQPDNKTIKWEGVDPVKNAKKKKKAN